MYLIQLLTATIEQRIDVAKAEKRIEPHPFQEIKGEIRYWIPILRKKKSKNKDLQL